MRLVLLSCNTSLIFLCNGKFQRFSGVQKDFLKAVKLSAKHCVPQRRRPLRLIVSHGPEDRRRPWNR